MLSTVSRPKGEAVAIHTKILLHNLNLKNDFVLEKSSYLTIKPYDLEGLKALINDDTCQTYIRVYRTLKDCDFSPMIVSSEQLQID
jgi:hypothetical protein